MKTDIDPRGPIRWVLAFAFLTLAGCATGQPPRAELGAAQTSLATAERAGAAEHAPVELNSARRKLQAAQDAVRDEEYQKAERLASEANIDAQLATAKSQAAASETALNQVHQDMTTLRSETAPGSRTTPAVPSIPRSSP